MTTTLASLGIDPTSHGFISADLLLASKLTALYQYAKSLEERVKELEGLERHWGPIETLPFDDEYYLFSDEVGDTFSALSMKDGTILAEFGVVTKDTLTHWMPWPKAPKSVTTETI